MRLRIEHTTGYRYDTEVSRSYNEARLLPVTGLEQTTLEARVQTRPEVRQQRYWDYWGTQVTAFDLHVPHTELEVRATSLVDTGAGVEPRDVPTWSLYAGEPVRDRFVEMLTPTGRTTADEEMTTLAQQAVAGLDPAPAARAIADLVRERVAYRPGTTGVATSATEAWALGQGVCQDITHVALTMLRAAGLPARYVSGYLHPRPDAQVGETVTGESHAWVEVWLGDWWGYDPTNAAPAGERHVVVARGRDYGDVTPLKGVYSGGGSQSLGVTVEVTRLQ
jgi:transglutaminase-like putative cysteine protease